MKKSTKIIISVLIFLTVISAIGITIKVNNLSTNLFISKNKSIRDGYSATWYEDYTYVLDNTNHTITLKKYNGDATEVIVPSKAIIDGVTYNTIVSGDNISTNSLFSYNQNITKVTFENGTKAGETLKYLFYDCNNLEEIIFNDFDTSASTNMQGLFQRCFNLRNVDVSGFNTSNVTTFESMFMRCESLTSIDVSNFDTSSATNMRLMFYTVKKVTKLDLSNFDTSNVTNFAQMLGNNNALKEVDISSFDTSFASVTPVQGAMYYFLYSTPNITKITLGPNTDLHVEDQNISGAAFGRGIWERESDGATFNGVELAKKTSSEDMSGTYIKKSSIVSEMNITFPVTYRIGKLPGTIEGFTTSNPDLIKVSGRNIYFDGYGITTESEYHLDDFYELTYPDVVTDEAGNKYNLKIRVDNFYFYDFDQITESKFIIIFSAFSTINFRNNGFTDTTFNFGSESKAMKYDITLSITDHNGTPVNGTYIFSANDLDIPSARDYDPDNYIGVANRGYGTYSEGINMIEGFDVSTYKTYPESFLVKDGNRIYGTHIDEGTELTEFIIKADASKTKFTWTGHECGTSFLSYYQPRVVDFAKKDEYGNYLPGAAIELYKDTETTPFKTWTSTNENQSFFLNPGVYNIKETSAPTGYLVHPPFTFYADINDKLTVDGVNVNEITITDEGEPYDYTVNYYDKSNNNLLKNEDHSGKYHQTINSSTHKLDIPNYAFDSWDKETLTIDMDTTKNVINMYYTKKTSNFVVRHVDEDGEDLDPSKNRHETLYYGDSYTSGTLPFKNYIYDKTTGDAPSGTISKDSYEIIYHYKIDPASLGTSQGINPPKEEGEDPYIKPTDDGKTKGTVDNPKTGGIKIIAYLIATIIATLAIVKFFKKYKKIYRW